MGSKMGPFLTPFWVHFGPKEGTFGVQKWVQKWAQNGSKNGSKKGPILDPLKTPLKTAFSGSGQKGPILDGKTKGSRSGLFCHRQKGSKPVRRGPKVGYLFDRVLTGFGRESFIGRLFWTTSGQTWPEGVQNRSQNRSKTGFYLPD